MDTTWILLILRIKEVRQACRPTVNFMKVFAFAGCLTVNDSKRSQTTRISSTRCVALFTMCVCSTFTTGTENFVEWHIPFCKHKMALKNISLESDRRPGRAIGSSTTTSVRGQHGYNQVYLWFVTQEDSHGGFVPRKLHTFTASLSALLRAFSDSGAQESEGMSGGESIVNLRQPWGLDLGQNSSVWSNILSGADSQEQHSE